MSIVVAILLGLAIGAVLGALGGGGAILTVPVLVYVVGQSAQDATTSSLVIVGATAAIAVVDHHRSGGVRWRVGLGLGAAGVPAAWAGSYLNRLVDEDVLLLGFAAVMLLAAAGMVRNGKDQQATDRTPDTGRGRAVLVAKVVAAGLLVGFLTGFFGVGGGFVIVPVLVMALGYAMPVAVGTSLLVIALNSAVSLMARAGSPHFDWAIIVPFTAAAVAGTFLGRRVAERVDATVLKRSFAALLVLVAGYVAAQSLVLG